MEYWIDMQQSEQDLSREKEKATKLKKTNWWRSWVQQGECYYCQKEVSPEELTMDHVVPLSRGGKSTKGNVVPCCKECNNKKKYYTPAEMILYEMEQKGQL